VVGIPLESEVVIKMKIKILTVFVLFSMNSGLLAEESEITKLMQQSACMSDCVEGMDACYVELEPKCEPLENKEGCYEPCDSAYTTCLGECGKFAPDFEALQKLQQQSDELKKEQ
jgi:hypothetical protein